jgi:ubiquinone/menaquinone biosynthesis C-methylase UbiE
MPISFDRLGRWFDLFSTAFYPKRAKQHVADFIRTIEPAGFVIDLGGGTGTLLNLAYRMRTDLAYFCADPALGMLKYVRRYAYRVAARGEYLPFKGDIVAAVMIGDAIHHFTDPEGAIEEVSRILKGGGKLFLFDLNSETFMGRIVFALEKLLGEPGNFYSPEQLRDVLVKKDFAVLTEGHGWRYTLEAQKE